MSTLDNRDLGIVIIVKNLGNYVTYSNKKNNNTNYHTPSWIVYIIQWAKYKIHSENIDKIKRNTPKEQERNISIKGE